MKRNTRQEILKTAKKLFNERGFNKVSNQEIADAVGIRKGNLTYHFNKKKR
ncbi:MAG: TetR/AcrR family transcriptional regulator [Candidatus Fimivivens sp.]